MMFEAEWKDDGNRDRCVAWVRRVWSATEKFAEGTYNNFDRPGDERRLQTIYGEDKYRKLRLLKAKYDPENVFNRNHNITPADDVVANKPRATRRGADTMMRVAHLTIHAYDMEESVAFYRDVLGFVAVGESARTPGAQAMVCRAPDVRGHLEFDLVDDNVCWKLPNPYHFALESDPASFENIYATLMRRGAKTLSAPPPEPNTGGYGEVEVRGIEYRRFLFVDPTLVYHELMVRVAPESSSQLDPAETLRVNHLIMGARDVTASGAFYASLFGFKDLGENPHAEGSRTMVHYSADRDETFEIVVHPYDDWLTPNPSHVSLEVDRDTFDQILAAADELRITIFAEWDPTSRLTGCSEFEQRSTRYRRFFVVDPSNTRIEVLTTA